MAVQIDLGQLIAEIQNNLADLDDAGIMGDGIEEVDDAYLSDLADEYDGHAG